MALQIDLVPIFEDNYVFVLSNPAGEVYVVDPGDAEPVFSFIRQTRRRLKGILITHHHSDHIGGLKRLSDLAFEESGQRVTVTAPMLNREQIPSADCYVSGTEVLNVLGRSCEILHLPGHTMGHVAYYFKDESALFSGDVLFGLGCGRLFEGSPETAFMSLKKIAALPSNTKIYCTHEYTERNLKFCRHLIQMGESGYLQCAEDLEKYAEALKLPSVPLNLAYEMKANPFMRAKTTDEFARLRELRNKFRG